MNEAKRRRELRLGSLGFILALALPLITSSYSLHILDLALISAVLCIGLNFALGYAGLISLGHAAFWAIGAYTSALVTTRLGLSYWLGLPLSVLAAMLTAFLVGAPMLRLRGHYLALAAMGFNEIVLLVSQNWVPVTGGTNGVGNIPAPRLFGFAIDGDLPYFYFLLVALGLVTWLAYQLRHSHIGRALIAVRDDEIATNMAGVNVAWLKMYAFVVSAAYAGFAGNLFAHLTHFISPNDFTVAVSIMLLTMLIVGGEGSILGSILGAVLLTFLPEWLRFLDKGYMVFYGFMMLLILVFMPNGLMALVSSVEVRLARRPRAAAEATGTSEGPVAERREQG